jgi:ribonuclease HI
VNETLPEDNKTPRATWEKVGEQSDMWEEGDGMGERRWQRKACARFSRKQADTTTHIHTQPPPAYQLDGGEPLEYDDLLNGHQTIVQQAIHAQGELPDLAHDYTDFLYTDGSRMTEVTDGAPGIGAAVYNPKTRSVTSIEVAWDGEAADTKSNTINRAELVGLLIAMRQEENCRWHDGSIHIATDSLASMYAIAKTLKRPQDVTEHRHLSILQEIVQEIRNAPGQVHVHKVMAHTGIIGNEVADQAAVRLASGESTADTTYDSPSNSRSDMHWPHQVTQKQTNTGQTITCVTPIADLGDTLKKAVHQQNKHGHACQDGVYASAWARADNIVHHESSHMFINSPTVRYVDRKRVLQYRWGLLPTARWLCKIGKSINNTCPLCRGEDGGHHAISGCPRLSAAYTARHNDAGTEILEAIGRGQLGQCVVMSDVGMSRRRSQAELPESMQTQRFMQHIAFPSTIPPRLQDALREYRESVPDILMVESADEGTYYMLVEVKYCRDTDPTGQQDRASNQHEPLRDLIKQNDPLAVVLQLNITLGVSGVIYKDFTENMEKLGVRGTAAKSLARRLHFLAVKHLNKIWALRTSLVHGKKHRQGHRGTGATNTRASQAIGIGPIKRRAIFLEPDHRKRQRKR